MLWAVVYIFILIIYNIWLWNLWGPQPSYEIYRPWVWILWTWTRTWILFKIMQLTWTWARIKNGSKYWTQVHFTFRVFGTCFHPQGKLLRRIISISQFLIFGGGGIVGDWYPLLNLSLFVYCEGRNLFGFYIPYQLNKFSSCYF